MEHVEFDVTYQIQSLLQSVNSGRSKRLISSPKRLDRPWSPNILLFFGSHGLFFRG